MAFVDPDRFKRFEKFVLDNLRPFADAAAYGYNAKGKGVVVYMALDDQFTRPPGPLRFQYKTKAEIDAAHGDTRDDLLQGLLDRYQPPGEAVFLALYPDNTYDITRVALERVEGGSPRPGSPVQ
jgi:hypothetical protein